MKAIPMSTPPMQFFEVSIEFTAKYHVVLPANTWDEAHRLAGRATLPCVGLEVVERSVSTQPVRPKGGDAGA